MKEVYSVSCFMHSNLTSTTGYFDHTVPRYLPYEFRHHFRMTKRTFQIDSGNKSSSRAVDSQNMHLAWLGKQLQTTTAHGWYTVTPIDLYRLLTIHKGCNDRCFPPFWTWKILKSAVLGLRMERNG